MLWIRVASDIVDNPKIDRLANRLRISVLAAVGHLISLWGWTARHRPDGNLAGISHAMIARAAHWKGRPRRLLGVLREVGFLTSDQEVHDWDAMNGRALRDAARKREERKACKGKAERDSVSADTSVEESEGASALTKRNGTKRILKRGSAPSIDSQSRSRTTRSSLAQSLRFEGFNEDQINRGLGLLKGVNGDATAVLAAMLEARDVAEADKVPGYARRVLEGSGPSEDSVKRAKDSLSRLPELSADLEDALGSIGKGGAA